MTHPINHVIYIVGPTASGKSEFALLLAEYFQGCIINCDARQIYREARIGTASPSDEDFTRIPHRLYNFLEPDRYFSAGEFMRNALVHIRKCHESGLLPIIVGGTGLYYRSLRYGLPEIHIPDAEKKKYRQEIREHGVSRIYDLLCELDPVLKQKIHPHDKKRIERAYIVYRHTNHPPSQILYRGWEHEQVPGLAIGLSPPPHVLQARIQLRTNKMFAQGWVDEVRKLMQTINLDAPVFESIGYRDIAQTLLNGNTPGENVKKIIYKRTWLLARKQLKWFRAEPDIFWYSSPPPISSIAKLLQTFSSS